MHPCFQFLFSVLTLLSLTISQSGHSPELSLTPQILVLPSTTTSSAPYSIPDLLTVSKL